MALDEERLAEHLTEADLRFLVETVAPQRDDAEQVITLVRDKPDLLAIMLEDDALYARLKSETGMVFKISPYLLFSILLRQARDELDERSYTLEPAGYRQQVPVFDVSTSRRLLDDGEMRAYLTGFFVSFTRIGSTTVVFRRGDRRYRRHFSDFDMDDLIRLCNLMDEGQKFSLYRRLGDLALFLSGVFADHIYTPRQHPARQALSRRLEDFDQEGRHYYRLASQHETAGRHGLQAVLGCLSERFGVARRLVGHVARRYMDLGASHGFVVPEGN